MQLLSGRRGIKRLLYVILPGACPVMPNQRLKAKGECGGWGGIRTHGEREPTAVFKTAALNHSATHPAALSSRTMSGGSESVETYMPAAALSARRRIVQAVRRNPCAARALMARGRARDRKSTRLNSSH